VSWPRGCVRAGRGEGGEGGRDPRSLIDWQPANSCIAAACLLHPPAAGCAARHRLSDLDLGHFEIRKENVHISLAPPSERAGALEGLKDAFVIEVRGVRARIPGLKWSFELLTFPYLNSEGLASAVLEGERVASCPGPACLPHLGPPLPLTPSPHFLVLRYRQAAALAWASA